MKQGPAILALLIMAAVAVIFVVGLFGALPPGLEEPVSQLISRFSFGHTEPSLQKFEGRWKVELADGTPLSDCKGAEGTLKVHNGAFDDSIGDLGQVRTLRGTIEDSGAFEASVVGHVRRGEAAAVIQGSKGSGEWTDDSPCRAEVTLTKLDPIIDPVAATLISFDGTVSIRRAGNNEKPGVRIPLYQGDVVSVSQGRATISRGGYPPDITELVNGQTYTVPAK